MSPDRSLTDTWPHRRALSGGRLRGAATLALSNTTADLRAGGSSVDTDNNTTDFTAGTPDPHGSGGVSTPPTNAYIHDVQHTEHARR